MSQSSLLAFIHIPKCAGTTVELILRSTFGLRHCDIQPWELNRRFLPVNYDDLRRASKFYPYLQSIAGHRVRPYSDLDRHVVGVDYFTMIREPVSRTISLYFQKVRSPDFTLSLEEWLQHPSAANGQVRSLTQSGCFADAIEIIDRKRIFVGLVERFDESLLLLQRDISPSLHLEYKRMNISKNKDITSENVMNPEIMAKIIENNREDIKLYEYIAHEQFPARIARYGEELTHLARTYPLATGSYRWVNVTANRLHRNLIYKPTFEAFRRWGSRR